MLRAKCTARQVDSKSVEFLPEFMCLALSESQSARPKPFRDAECRFGRFPADIAIYEQAESQDHAALRS